MDEAGPRGTLETVLAGEAKNKAVSKRARAMLQAMQDARNGRRDDRLEQWQQRVASIVARVEASAANPALPNARHGSSGIPKARGRGDGKHGCVGASIPTPPGGSGHSSRPGEDGNRGASARAEAERRAAAEHAAALRAGCAFRSANRLESMPRPAALDELDAAHAGWKACRSHGTTQPE